MGLRTSGSEGEEAQGPGHPDHGKVLFPAMARFVSLDGSASSRCTVSEV